MTRLYHKVTGPSDMLFEFTVNEKGFPCIRVDGLMDHLVLVPGKTSLAVKVTILDGRAVVSIDQEMLQTAA